MRAVTTGLAGRLAILLTAVMLLTIMAPAYSADKVFSGPVAISTVTDKAGSININVGKGEGIKEGAKGVIVKDGKEVAKYVVQQVNWGFSRITLMDVVDGYTVKPGDSAPFSGAVEEPSSSKKKSSKSKTLLTILAIGAAVFLLGGGGGGGGSSDAAVGAGNIVLTTKRQTTVDNGDNVTCVITITARVNDTSGFPVPDGTAVNFSSNAGTLNHTQTTTSAGKAYASLTYDSGVDPEAAVVTVRALGQTSTMEVSFISSIDLIANPETIQVRDSGGSAMLSTVTATCWDSDGHLATSGTVTFTATRGTVTPASATINGSGVATATYTSNVAGEADITASWSKSKATATVIVTAGPPQSLTVSADTVTVPCDGNSFATISATVKDVRGNNAADGTVVDFSVIPAAGGGGNGTITPQATTLNGVATTYLYTRDGTGVTSMPGTARVVAQVLRANQPPSVPLPASDLVNQNTLIQFISMNVGEIHLSAEPVNVRGWDIVGNTTTIKAVVYNTDSQPVPDGTAVYFTATHGVVRGTVSGNMSRTTNGQATATLTTDASGNGWDGLVDVTASSGGVDVTEPGLVIFSGPPVLANCDATISQTDLTAVNGQAFITVTAQDVNGNPVADGTSVTATTNRGTITGNGTTVGGNIAFTLTTSTDAGAPTPQGAGVVSITIASGGGTPPVVLTVNFTVVP